jgi:hypothetical protein
VSRKKSPRHRLLDDLADECLRHARELGRELRKELAKPFPEAEDIDAAMLDLLWALGERRGILNAIHDLAEAGLL